MSARRDLDVVTMRFQSLSAKLQGLWKIDAQQSTGRALVMHAGINHQTNLARTGSGLQTRTSGNSQASPVCQNQLGARSDTRSFHDAVLEDGALPLDVPDNRVQDWVDKRK